jgi:ABC-type antimicrobial peptide transport system permease subunit
VSQRVQRTVLREAIRSASSTPLKTAFTAVGVSLASLSFVVSSGAAMTLSHQVSSAFDAARATQVDVVVGDTASRPRSGGLLADRSCPALDAGNATRLSGVVSGGEFDVAPAATVSMPGSADPDQAALVGVDHGALAAMQVAVVQGRTFDDGHVARHELVGLLARPVAQRIGFARLGSAVLVNGHLVAVIGVFDATARRSEALGALVVPSSVLAYLLNGDNSEGRVTCGALLATAPGAGEQVADQAALALDPTRQLPLKVTSPPDPRTFRREVERPVQVLALALTAGSLLIGFFSIATTAAANAAARSGEIGLRRALGAGRLHILTQLVTESAAVGFLGAAVGAVLGTAAVIAYAFVEGAVPVMSMAATTGAAVAGGVVGGVAGLAPAARAARLDPVVALRR